MAGMPDRIVRRRRDGLVQIRPARFLERARPLARDFLLAMAVVVVGSLAYFAVMMAFYLLAILFGLWAVRTLWREVRPRPRIPLASARPRLAVVPRERRTR
jgi:hypothetical protein